MNLKRVSPQQKILGVNDKFGNTGIKYQQGTTRIIYDALPLVESSGAPVTYTFFKDCKTRNFPLTNLPENKLQVGESISLQSYYMAILNVTEKNGKITQVNSIAPLSANPATRKLFRGDGQFMIGNNRVLKDISLTSNAAPFNVSAQFGQIVMASETLTNNASPADNTVTVNEYGAIGHEVYNLKTDLVIPPDIEFWFEFKAFSPAPDFTKSGTNYLFVSFEGVGSILAPRATF